MHIMNCFCYKKKHILLGNIIITLYLLDMSVCHSINICDLFVLAMQKLDCISQDQSLTQQQVFTHCSCFVDMTRQDQFEKLKTPQVLPVHIKHMY